jgi:hypothetical protein
MLSKKNLDLKKKNLIQFNLEISGCFFVLFELINKFFSSFLPTKITGQDLNVHKVTNFVSPSSLILS